MGDWKKNERTTKAGMGRLCAGRPKSDREDRKMRWTKLNGQGRFAPAIPHKWDKSLKKKKKKKFGQ